MKKVWAVIKHKGDFSGWMEDFVIPDATNPKEHVGGVLALWNKTLDVNRGERVRELVSIDRIQDNFILACASCGSDHYEGPTTTCPHCGRVKCSTCDMGDDLPCAVCDGDEESGALLVII